MVTSFYPGEASLDPGSPDFVPSVFAYNKQTPDSQQRVKRYQRKRKRDEKKSIPLAAKRSLLESNTEGKPTEPPVEEQVPVLPEQPAESTQQVPVLPKQSAESTQQVPVLPKQSAESTQQVPVLSEQSAESTEQVPVLPEQSAESTSETPPSYDELLKDYISLQMTHCALKKENEKLKEECLSTKFSYNVVSKNPSELLFYTGLSAVLLFQWLLSILKSSVRKVRQSLSLEDHLLIVLVKLRLGITNRDIAYRFQLTECYVSRILRSWLPVMSKVLSGLIKWPSRQAVKKNMPKAFKKQFRKCRCIIDCTEIFIDRPFNLTVRAQSWSNYKHNNTVKYLVAITPAGAISFLSPGWGGRVSDKQITMESGFLDKIEFGDEILADRVFLIRDELAAYGATLRIPYFTKGKKQLSANEVDTSRQLSRVRIHVERVIGRWKNFKILQSVIPISQVDLLDDMVIVCGALTNLCPSVVK